MTRYTVTWLKGAQNHLAQVWTDSPDRGAVAPAADTIDLMLSQEPSSKGTLVVEGLRSLHVPPLHVLFTMSEPDRLVTVTSVRRDDLPSASSQGNGQVSPTG